MVRMLFAGSPNLFAARHCLKTHLYRAHVRHFSNPQKYDGLVLGAYTDHAKVTLAGTRGVSDATQSSLLQQLEVSHFKKAGDVRVLYNLGGVAQVAVVSLGEEPKSPSEAVRLETARRAVESIVLSDRKGSFLMAMFAVDFAGHPCPQEAGREEGGRRCVGEPAGGRRRRRPRPVLV